MQIDLGPMDTNVGNGASFADQFLTGFLEKRAEIQHWFTRRRLGEPRVGLNEYARRSYKGCWHPYSFNHNVKAIKFTMMLLGCCFQSTLCRVGVQSVYDIFSTVLERSKAPDTTSGVSSKNLSYAPKIPGMEIWR